MGKLDAETLGTTLDEFYRQHPEAADALYLYEKASAEYEKALAALRGPYTIVTTDHTKPWRHG